MNKFRDMNPQVVFLIIGLIYGIGFLAITPPFQVPDEYEHFYRALYLSEGHIMPEKIGDKAGVYIPESVEYTANNISDNWHSFTVDRETNISISPLLGIPFNSKDRVFTDISRILVVTYSPVPYLAAAFGITMGKLLNLSPLVLMYIGRLINLLVWLFLGFLAIRITPVHKWVFLMLLLVPMTLFEAASLSADSFTMGLSFLVIAIFLKFAFDDNKKTVDIKDIYVLSLLMLLLVLSKQVYFLLILMFFLIPEYKFQTRKKMLLTFGFMLILTLLTNGIWSIFFNDLYMPIIPQVSIQSQVSFILSNPLNFPYVLLNTFIIRGLSYQFLFVGNFWLDVPLPIWWIGSYLLAIIPVALIDKNKINISRRPKLLSSMIFFFIAIVACASVYITWTPVGQNTIDGIQGRYFIPILPLLYLVLYNSEIKVPEIIRSRITTLKPLFNNKVKSLKTIFGTTIIIKPASESKIKFDAKTLNLIIIYYIIIVLSITLLIFIIEYYI